MEFLAVEAESVGRGGCLYGQSVVLPAAEGIVVVLFDDGAVPDDGTYAAEVVGDVIVHGIASAVLEYPTTTERHAFEGGVPVIDEGTEITIPVGAVCNLEKGSVRKIGVGCFRGSSGGYAVCPRRL